MDSHALDFVYFDSSKPAKLRVKYSNEDMHTPRSYRSLKIFNVGESAEVLKDVSIDLKK